ERIRSSVDDPSQPVLFLTDMVGGTPHNVVVSTLRLLPRGVCLSGVNLAVLVEAATSLQSLDAGAIDQLVATGRNSIVAASRRMAGEAE
ncbi:MAG TPA: hypothetical protein VIV06_04475, partial [Candidatus Limnocylindrales bacterium]